MAAAAFVGEEVDVDVVFWRGTAKFQYSPVCLLLSSILQEMSDDEEWFPFVVSNYLNITHHNIVGTYLSIICVNIIISSIALYLFVIALSSFLLILDLVIGVLILASELLNII